MRNALMFAVVGLQVVVFQFLATRWASLLPDYLVDGRAAVPADEDDSLPARSGALRVRTGRGQRVLGAALFVVVVVAAAATGLDPGARKLTLAALSLVSALAFLGGYLRDRAALTRLASSLPVAERRTASLERRKLARHYPLAWETVPAAVILLTLALSAAPLTRGREGLLWLPLLQLLVAGGGLLLSIGYARAASVPQRVRAAWPNPEAALRLDHRLRQLELRAFLAARIAIVLLLAVRQAGRALPAYAGAAGIGEWLVVGALLGIFAAYLLLAGRPVAHPPGQYRAT